MRRWPFRLLILGALLAAAMASRAAPLSSRLPASDVESAASPSPDDTLYLPVVFRAFTPLPDLVVSGMRIELQTGGACDYTSTNLGSRVWVRNVGWADAGPFMVEVNGEQTRVEGLAAGQTTDCWFPRYVYGGLSHAYVDATFEVTESDENNNDYEQMVPIPTLPPTCTATPTPAVTPTPTATPTRPGRDGS